LHTSRMNSSPIFRTRAGGVTPVGNIRRYESETHIAGDMSRMQPRAGGVSPPWDTSAVTNRKRTPQQVYRACNQEWGASAPRAERIVGANRKRPFSAASTHIQPRAGGVSPPWNASGLVRAKTCATASAFRSHGGLTGGVLVGKNRAPLARRFRSHGRLTPRCACAQRAFTDDSRTPCTIVLVEPRRADARRSCEHAFVHRKRRYFAADRAPCTPARAGV
jgi:hypothetical protein